MEYAHAELTEEIIGAFYEVYNYFGYGFLEKVYENALMLELSARGVEVRAQIPIGVRYKGASVGEYVADIVVPGKVIVEVKAAKVLAPEHQAQLLNYLKATGIKVGLLLNFGPRPEIKRLVY